MITLFTALAAATSFACQPLPGADRFARETTANWLFLGESHHGTIDGPQAAVDLLCALMNARRPLVVAIEHASPSQPLLNAYLTSDGGPAARARLFAGFNWDPDYQDGKGSEAMLGFIDWLRRQVQAKRIKEVIAFDGYMVSGNADRNRKMADALSSANPRGKAIVVALTGSVHAQRARYSSDRISFDPPGVLLPHDRTISILIRADGGSAWSCDKQGCGARSTDPSPAPTRGLAMKRTADGLFDGILEIGRPETASPPANRK